MAITNGYCSLNEVKSALRITDSVDDSLLEMAVESASRLIDGFTNRLFYNDGTAARYFVAQSDTLVYVDDIPGTTAGTSITIQTSDDGITFDTTWSYTNGDFQLEPLNAVADGIDFSFYRIRATEDFFWPILGNEALVKVTSPWGWSAVPIAIKQATVIQGSRIFSRLQSPLAVAGFNELGVVRVTRYLDPDVEQLVMPYRKMRQIA